MATYISTVHVDVPPEVAFGQLFESMMESSGGTRVTEAPTEGLGAAFHYELRVLGRAIGGTCTVTEYVPSTTLTLQWHGPERFTVGDLRGVWTFAPDDGGTTVTVRSVFKPRIPILQDLAGRVMIRAFRKAELPAITAGMEKRSRGVQLTP
jgi:uncharacterized protein YndB with AHSA1/START domain